MNDWLPPGLFAYGSELAAAIDSRLGRTLVGDGDAWIDLPRRLGTADVPSIPVPWGDGALCVDLGPDDIGTWERFAQVHRNEPDPETVAVACAGMAPASHAVSPVTCSIWPPGLRVHSERSQPAQPASTARRWWI